MGQLQTQSFLTSSHGLTCGAIAKINPTHSRNGQNFDVVKELKFVESKIVLWNEMLMKYGD